MDEKKTWLDCVQEISDYAKVGDYEWLLDDLKVITDTISGKAQLDGSIINNPDHYNIDGFNATEVMEAIFGLQKTRDFFLLSAFKYLFRHNRKNGEQDLLKARRCLNIWYDLGGYGED